MTRPLFDLPAMFRQIRQDRSEGAGAPTAGALSRIAPLLIAVALFAGCGQQATVSQQPPASQETRLPISLNEVMVALVNHAADPIWVAAWNTPETDEDWRNIERLSYQLQVAGALLVIPGTGPMDDAWVANPAWKQWSEQLREAGSSAVAAAKARDIAGIASSGDQIVEVCEGCHLSFKPDVPTGGIFGELSPNEADFEDDKN